MDLRITFYENHPLLMRNFIILLLKRIDENDQHLIVMIICNGFFFFIKMLFIKVMTNTLYCNISLRNVSSRLNFARKEKMFFRTCVDSQAVENVEHGFLSLCHCHLFKDGSGRFSVTKSLLGSCKG